MDALTPRFTRELNMTVVRMTKAEKDAAQARFDELRTAQEADGTINAGNFGTAYKNLWAQTHHGADAVQEVPDDTLLEPLPAAA